MIPTHYLKAAPWLRVRAARLERPLPDWITDKTNGAPMEKCVASGRRLVGDYHAHPDAWVVDDGVEQRVTRDHIFTALYEEIEA